MPVTQPTRPLAKRIDGDYVERSHPMRSWRRALTWGAAALALGWFAWRGVSYNVPGGGRPRLAGTIANPGPVSTAHAYFEHDCAVCHTGGGDGGLTRGVTDAACLTCHDGAVHNRNQKIASDERGVSRATFTLALADKSHPKGKRSAACATCHVEHRGRPALAATSDAHCATCHADLERAAGSTPTVRASITAFDAAHHPLFGRELHGGGGRLNDPTRLKFNHAVHQRVREGALRNCAICHETDRATGVADGRYMRPINYATHCASCHRLDVAGEVTVAHEDLAIVRAQLADVDGIYRRALAAKSPEEREKALKDGGGGGGARRSRGRSSDGGGEAISEDEWVKQQVAKLGDQIRKDLEPGDKMPEGASTTSVATQPGGDEIVAKLLERYAVFGASNRCSLCHDIDTSGPMLATAPTGRALDAPRRWFTSSRFNHEAHRNINCLDCHAAAPASTATADVLLPDLTTRGGSSGLSCVDCHQPSRGSQRSAPSSCVTCHVYHDRTMERPAVVVRPSAP